jgi:G3E family GTPase
VPAPVDRIPVSLLTGFLGSGKTTLLNHWMSLPEMAGSAVLVNEFGEVGVDHHLVEKVDDQLWLLDSGCLCCAVQGDLIGALKDLAARSSRGLIPPVTRVIIETSGLADPVPVIYALMEDAFVAARHVCDGVITVVSASHGLQQIRDHAEALRQVVAADALLISKCDQASSLALHTLEDELHQLNPGAPCHPVRNGLIDASVLLGRGIYSATHKSPDLARWLSDEAAQRIAENNSPDKPPGWLMDHPSHESDDPEGSPLAGRWQDRTRQPGATSLTAAPHSTGISSFVIEFDPPVPWLGFAVTMGQVLATHGAKVLRVKGLMNIAGNDTPQVIQCVQGVAYPSVSLAGWPKDGPYSDGRGRLVFITRGLSAERVEAIRSALSTFPGDAAALRMSAGDLMLPTRCWLSQRMAPAAAGAIEHDGWVVQTKRLRRPSGG